MSRPAKSGLYGTRSFFVKYKDPKREIEVSLGVWHVLPNHIVRRFAKQLAVEPETVANMTIHPETERLAKRDEKHYDKIAEKFGENFQVFESAETQRQFFEEVLQKTNTPVMFYLHGNTASRGATHRVEMYQVLRQLGFHVISLDYRGYGDSSNLGPSARSVILDSQMVFQHIVAQNPNIDILMWGHSLGTGIGTHLMAELHKVKNSKLPMGVILESPFNNIKEEITEHPFAKLYRNLPWFEFTIVNPMYENQLMFESDKWIGHIEQPIMILHAEDDHVVPFDLGYKVNCHF